MKFAYYLTEGVEQFVLTPENDTERKLVDMLTSRDGVDVSILKGQFYQCRGGWVRQGPGEDSALVVVRKSTNPEKGLPSPTDAEQFDIGEDE